MSKDATDGRFSPFPGILGIGGAYPNLGNGQFSSSGLFANENHSGLR